AQKQVDNVNRVNREHLSGIRVIHAFNAFDYQEERFGEVNESLFKASRSVDRRTGLFAPFMTSMMNLLNVLIYFVGAFVISGAASGDRLQLFSDMVTFSSYAVLVMSAFVQLLLIYIGIVKAMASWDRISEVLKSDISIQDGADEQEDKKDGSIVFENVSFEYPGAGGYALKDINLSIKKGQTVAFIGATGSGKTSILNLIPRFYDATKGRVLVDGKDVRDYKLRDLRNKLGYIPQKSMLFSGTISDNIAYGDNGRFQATLTEIKKASEVGQAREFIEKKEGGYDAKVAEGGKNFSGGQKQRLTISRAICRDPEIYLFDDSFSALDFKTDRMLRDRLKEVAADATVLIVAQRIGTIMGADCIYVIDKGQIVGAGKHDELLSSCPIYQEIASSQMMERGAAV
ncbi:MAG: ABC transporter ATP-binding protein, partial [Eubacterium sp.]|nr:ABC transporter ATP-binding protein [Eubacterium sp.]